MFFFFFCLLAGAEGSGWRDRVSYSKNSDYYGVGNTSVIYVNVATQYHQGPTTDGRDVKRSSRTHLQVQGD
jgi:hypothetical protein